jgi:Rieske Fe-S protein
MAEPSPKPGNVRLPPPAPAAARPGRRNILTALAATMVGLVLMVFPFAAGTLVFLDPLLRRKSQAAGGSAPGKWLRITSVAAVPASGEPAQFPVIDDLVDAWNRQPEQPVGAVYLRRVPQDPNDSAAAVKIQAFNAICPHAGCFVAFSDDSRTYKCPCHNSSFQIDGSTIEGSVTPRPLDELEVDPKRVTADGEVWVRFANFVTGKHEKIAK